MHSKAENSYRASIGRADSGLADEDFAQLPSREDFWSRDRKPGRPPWVYFLASTLGSCEFWRSYHNFMGFKFPSLTMSIW